MPGHGAGALRRQHGWGGVVLPPQPCQLRHNMDILRLVGVAWFVLGFALCVAKRRWRLAPGPGFMAVGFFVELVGKRYLGAGYYHSIWDEESFLWVEVGVLWLLTHMWDDGRDGAPDMAARRSATRDSAGPTSSSG